MRDNSWTLGNGNNQTSGYQVFSEIRDMYSSNNNDNPSVIQIRSILQLLDQVLNNSQSDNGTSNLRRVITRIS